MKYLAGLLLTFVLINHAAATVLCEASCQLTITFPEGGSIAANEQIILTFGSGGVLDLGATGTINSNPQPLSTDYSTGGQLLLAKGESIGFDAGGSLILGTGGNIDYTDMAFESTGGASLSATGGSNPVIVIDNLTISGGLNITLIAGSISVAGNLTVTSGSALNLVADTGASTASICSLQDSSGLVLSSGAGTIDTTDSCATISSNLSLAEGALSVLTSDPNAVLVVDGSIVIQSVIDPGDVTLIEGLTPSLLSSLPDNTELPANDGSTCTMISGRCIAASGVEYIVVEGKLVPASEDNSAVSSSAGSGGVGPVCLLVLVILLTVFRVQKRDDYR